MRKEFLAVPSDNFNPILSYENMQCVILNVFRIRDSKYF